MRKYNFAIRFTEQEPSSPLCRIRFNERFDAADLVNDFPRNVTADCLNHVIKSPTGRSYEYRAVAQNAVEIVASGEPKSLSDSQRAVLLNLIDFGQDFESERSTTVEEVEFPVRDSHSYTVERILEALEAETDAAIKFMNGLMREYPADSEDAAKEWPSEDHDRYFYQVRLEQTAEMQSSVITEFEKMLEALHKVNMWNGFSADTTAEEAVRSGRTGISYEIEVEPKAITYLVERPACDPALSILWLWQRVEDRLGRPAASSTIFVTGED